MSVDTVGNFLTTIRNATFRASRTVVVPYSKFKYEIALILQQEGFVKDVLVKAVDEIRKEIVIQLKYVNNESVIHAIDQISKPGRRIYASAQSVPSVIGGLGIAVVSTSNGVMTDKTARKKGVGGEVVCAVW